ncbi:MAG: hypothetical protein O7D33_00905, partial [Chloroflexi bacterium]|nr:hypothetical protein [Chloroflexota bacterium]
LFSIGKVNAGSSAGALADPPAISAGFEGGLGMAAGSGWSWTGDGNQIKVGVFLAGGLTTIAEIEVFVGDAVIATTAPVLSQRPSAGGVFPTGVNIVFAGTISGLTTALVPGTTRVGIHLSDAADTDIVRSSVPTNIGLVDLTVPVTAPSTTKPPVIAQPVGSPTPIPPSETPTPPAAGDLAPSSSLVLSIMLGGLLLVAVGGVYMVGSRKVKQ